MNATELKALLLLGLLAFALAEESTATAEKKDQVVAEDKKSEDKPKRGLDLSLGDHFGFDEHLLGGGGHFAGGLGHEHVSHDHIKAVTITKHVPEILPYPVIREKHVPVPNHIYVKIPVDRPYPVHVPQPYPVVHHKHIPVIVEKPAPYAVKIPVKVPVKVPYEVHVPVKVPYEVHKPVPYAVKVPVVVKEPYPVYIKDHHHHHHEHHDLHGYGHHF